MRSSQRVPESACVSRAEVCTETGIASSRQENGSYENHEVGSLSVSPSLCPARPSRAMATTTPRVSNATAVRLPFETSDALAKATADPWPCGAHAPRSSKGTPRGWTAPCHPTSWRRPRVALRCRSLCHCLLGRVGRHG